MSLFISVDTNNMYKQKDKIEESRTQLFYDSNIMPSIALTILSFIYIRIFDDIIDKNLSILLFISMLAPPFFRLLIILIYKFKEKTINLHYKTLDQTLCSLTIITGLTWSYVFYEFYLVSGHVEKIILIASAAGFVAAGGFVYTAKLKTALIYQLSHISGITYSLYSDSDLDMKVLSSMAVVFGAVMLHGTWIYFKTINNSIKLKFEKDDLVEELNLKNKEILDKQKKVIHSSRLAAVGEMSAGIAHEINNPLTIIKMASKRLLKVTDHEKKDKLVEDISQSTERIINIIQSLRKFSREDKAVDVKIYDINKVIEESLNLCRSRIKNSGIELKVNLTSKNTEVSCNSIQISQVILNLLNNAFDAISESSVDPNKSLIEVQTNNIDYNTAQILITNTGDIIAPEVMEKIFQPFFTTKGIGKGTGLGLSISKGIIEEHNGSISVQSTEEKTIFTISLPITKTVNTNIV